MIRVFVSTFGKPTGWIRDALPVEVGAYGRTDHRDEKTLYDDTGDSISAENAYFGELTGLYWIWRNQTFEAEDIIGFCHYNKCLDRRGARSSGIRKTFAKNPGSFWILREPEIMVPHDYPEDIDRLREILAEEEPGYLEAFDALYNRNGASRCGAPNCHTGQLFYTDNRSFQGYCEFLFRVLFRLREAIGDTERPAYHNRYCAFMGERLLSVYVLRNRCSYETRNVQYHESAVFRGMRLVGSVLRPIRRKMKAGPSAIGMRLMQSHRSSYQENPDSGNFRDGTAGKETKGAE